MPASSTRSGPLAASARQQQHLQPTAHDQRPPHRARSLPPCSSRPPPRTSTRRSPALEEKGRGPAPALPVAPLVINRGRCRSRSVTTSRRRCSTARWRKSSLPTARSPGPLRSCRSQASRSTRENAEGDETQRRSVRSQQRKGLAGRGRRRQGGRQQGPRAAARDPRCAARVARRFGRRARREATRPPLSKPSATGGSSSSGVPKKSTMDRPAATESGRFRSDTRYKRKRGKALPVALAVLVIGGGVACGGLLREGSAREARRGGDRRRPPRSPPIAPGQVMPGADARSRGPQATAPRPETAPGTTGTARTRARMRLPPSRRKPPPRRSRSRRPRRRTWQARREGGCDRARKGSRREAGAAPEGIVGEAPRARRAPPWRSPPRPPRRNPRGKRRSPAPRPRSRRKRTKPAEGDKTDKPAEAAAEKKPAAEEAKPTAPPVLKITSSPGRRRGGDRRRSRGNDAGLPEGHRSGRHARDLRQEGRVRIARAHDQRLRLVARQGRRAVAEVQRQAQKTGGGEAAKPADTGEKKPPDVEILTPSEP